MLHLLKSITSSLESDNYHAAVMVAITLPDICGWLESPTAGSKARYISWFEKYVGPRYRVAMGHDGTETTFLSGSDCDALRCALLHEGRDEISEQRARELLDRFKFIAVPAGEGLRHCNRVDETLELQVDIFCAELMHGAATFMVEFAENEAVSRRASMLTQFMTSKAT